MKRRTFHKAKNSPPKNVLWLLGAAGGILLITLVSLPFFRNETQQQNASVTPVGVIAQYPDQFENNEVAVEGRVDDRLGPRAFTVNGTGILKEQVLVVSKNPLQAVGGGGDDYDLFDDTQDIQVDGEVRAFNLSEIEDEIGFDLDDQAFASYEGKPVIIADTVKNTR